MNSYTSNPDEAENSTGKSMKKNIPGLALLLLDLAVALVGFYIGTHFFGLSLFGVGGSVRW